MPDPGSTPFDLHVVRRRTDRLTDGRKFNAEELQLMLLGFLREAPAHGYELIRRFDETSGGYYSPSPGALYPALARLEELGLAQAETSGRRRNHAITRAGRAYLQSHAEQARTLRAIIEHAARKMLWMKHAGESDVAAAAVTGWLPELVQSRKALQAALLTRSNADHREQRRIAAILQRAVRSILEAPTDKTPTDKTPSDA